MSLIRIATTRGNRSISKYLVEPNIVTVLRTTTVVISNSNNSVKAPTDHDLRSVVYILPLREVVQDLPIIEYISNPGNAC